MARVDDLDEVLLVVSELASDLRRRCTRGEDPHREEIVVLREAADRLHAIARGLSRERLQAPITHWPAAREVFAAASSDPPEPREAPTLRMRPLR